MQYDDKFRSDILKALNKEEVHKNVKRKSRQFEIKNDTLYYKQYINLKNITLYWYTDVVKPKF